MSTQLIATIIQFPILLVHVLTYMLNHVAISA